MGPRVTAPGREDRGRVFDCRLPEGDLKIAHPFRGGFVVQGPQVPKGRPKTLLQKPVAVRNALRQRMSCASFSRPFGTDGIGNLNPAVNCRAILNSPSGRVYF